MKLFPCAFSSKGFTLWGVSGIGFQSILRSFLHTVKARIQPHPFVCGDLVFPAPFVVKTVDICLHLLFSLDSRSWESSMSFLPAAGELTVQHTVVCLWALSPFHCSDITDDVAVNNLGRLHLHVVGGVLLGGRPRNRSAGWQDKHGVVLGSDFPATGLCQVHPQLWMRGACWLPRRPPVLCGRAILFFASPIAVSESTSLQVCLRLWMLFICLKVTCACGCLSIVHYFPSFSTESLVLSPFIFKSFIFEDIRPLSMVSVMNFFSLLVICLLTLSPVLLVVKKHSHLPDLVLLPPHRESRWRDFALRTTAEGSSLCFLLEDGGPVVCILLCVLHALGSPLSGGCPGSLP